MPPKGKAVSKGKGKGADGDAEPTGGGKQAKGGTAVKVFYVILCFSVIILLSLLRPVSYTHLTLPTKRIV